MGMKCAQNGTLLKIRTEELENQMKPTKTATPKILGQRIK